MIELNDYPKAKELYVKWCSSKYQLIFQGKELKGKEAERFAELTLQGNIRSLYDFYDSLEVYVTVYYTNEDKMEWYYDVNTFGYGEILDSRFEAERVAFEMAFKILERKLSDKEETV